MRSYASLVSPLILRKRYPIRLRYCKQRLFASMAQSTEKLSKPQSSDGAPAKLHGRAFYESIGSPKYIMAPMVDQSEFAWRMLSRSFMPPGENSNYLAYTPMLHARMYNDAEYYRGNHFQPNRAGSTTPWLDGNPSIDRPLFVQFCANDPQMLLEAARRVAPHCDAIDLNLGCPQGIARKGHYGAFLQEDQDLVFQLINTLHKELSIPVTAKIRILDTKEKTLEYAQNVLRAGASILTVHGRRREQKGHATGLADWQVIKWLRENLPSEVVLFANGNILQHDDIQQCLEDTGVDGIMSAEGNLSNPAIFATAPPAGQEGREYWRGKDGLGGWRVDAILRRYFDLLHKYASDEPPPSRRPLFALGDDTEWLDEAKAKLNDAQEPLRKKHKIGLSHNRNDASPNIAAIQAHLFQVLRHLISKHTDVRDMLSRTKRGLDNFERVLTTVEIKVAEGLLEYDRTDGQSFKHDTQHLFEDDNLPAGETSQPIRRKCIRPWWVAQPNIRPLPAEALAKGALQAKKAQKKNQSQNQPNEVSNVVATDKSLEESLDTTRGFVSGAAEQVQAEEPGSGTKRKQPMDGEQANHEEKLEADISNIKDELVAG